MPGKRTWIAGAAVGAPIVSRHSLDELLQSTLVASLLALAEGRGHGVGEVVGLIGDGGEETSSRLG